MYSKCSVGSTLSYLSPIGQNLTVAAVRDELFRKLGDTRIQVIHYHVHNGGSRLGSARVLRYWISSKKNSTIFSL